MDSKSVSEARPARLRSAAIVLVGGMAGALISLLMGQPLQRMLFDGWQRSTPRTIAADRVAVVLIDPLSLSTVGAWPWPRYYMARLTEKIAAQKPKAIAYDMIFPESDRLNPEHFAALYPELPENERKDIGELPSMDSMFAQTLGSSPSVLGRLGIIEGDGSDPKDLMADPLVEGRPPPATPRYKQVLTSIAELDDIALGHAMLNGEPDSDGIVRAVPLTVMAGTVRLPIFNVVPDQRIESAPSAIRANSAAMPGKGRVPAITVKGTARTIPSLAGSPLSMA